MLRQLRRECLKEAECQPMVRVGDSLKIQNSELQSKAVKMWMCGGVR